MPPRTILYLGDTAAIAGGEVSLLTLLQNLDRTRFEPVYVSAREGPYLDALRASNVPVYMVPMPDDVLSVSRTARLRHWSWVRCAGRLLPTCLAVARRAKAVKAHLIHTNAPKMHVVGLLAGKLLRLPVVCHVRSAHYFGAISLLLARLADRVICISQAAREATFRRYASRPNMVLVYNGRDLAHFVPRPPDAALKQELGISEGAKVVGMVAHLIPWKGHKLFLKAAQQIVLGCPHVRFLLVGGCAFCADSYQGELVRLAEDLGIRDKVVFAGELVDMPRAYSVIDVLVGASHNEPFGSVMIEAMAMERPVVATRSGGYPEIVVHGQTGLLTSLGSPGEMARAVLDLLHDPSRRDALGRAGRARVRALFSAEAHARQITQVYHEVLGQSFTGARAGESVKEVHPGTLWRETL